VAARVEVAADAIRTDELWFQHEWKWQFATMCQPPPPDELWNFKVGVVREELSV